MPRRTNAPAITIGIDSGKNTLHLVGLDARGGISNPLLSPRAWHYGPRVCADWRTSLSAAINPHKPTYAFFPNPGE